jgi:glutathione synthase/RimK-type ligase-like ATP-grasp enzyme
VILVVSYPGEEHTDDVVQRLEQLGREVVRIDLADFPAEIGMDLSWSSSASPNYKLNTTQGRVDLNSARVVWWRRIRPFMIDPAIASLEQRRFAESETTQAVTGLLDALPCSWVNPRESDAAAHHKPYQWSVAHEVGLLLPRTLVTNQADRAQEFIQSIGLGQVVFKPFLASIESWRETRLVEETDLEKIELVKYAPVIFQEYIQGVDLRITVIGDQILAAEIDARSTTYPVDMRMVVGEAAVQPVTLPEEIREKLLALQRRLGLVYGAIDMRRTDAGEYVFFEVNPAGQWHFVEQRTGLPISQTMADHLASLDKINPTNP